MTARRVAVAVLHTALGAAVLAAVVGVLWVAGSAVMGPNYDHLGRLAVGLFLLVVTLLGGGALIGILHEIGHAIADAIAGRRR